jgi:hypothetical protein
LRALGDGRRFENSGTPSRDDGGDSTPRSRNRPQTILWAALADAGFPGLVHGLGIEQGRLVGQRVTPCPCITLMEAHEAHSLGTSMEGRSADAGPPR